MLEETEGRISGSMVPGRVRDSRKERKNIVTSSCFKCLVQIQEKTERRKSREKQEQRKARARN